MSARLDMPIFKSTNPGVEVVYTLWRFDVDAFLEQYDEASMCPHIFASLRGYPGKWACMLDEGKDISVRDLLMHMEKTFGNKRDYDAPDRGWDLKKDRFYHGLCPYLHDALSFAMVELPEREQAQPTFDMLYTLAKKLEVGQLAHTCRYTLSSDMYREKHRHYPALAD